MTFALREHTADIAVAAAADSLGGVFGAVADGMAAAMIDDDVPATGAQLTVSERAESREAALYDYLTRLLYERDVQGVLPVDNAATVDEPTGGGDWRVTASARGVPLDAVHARDLKAVTYSEMQLTPPGGPTHAEAGTPPDAVREHPDDWAAYVVFDV
ncbi:archease [Halobacterium salinarum]|uniref:Homolog to archaease n=5 Tax=Halobacterium salinarum TaxID=2242 RepID=A0A510N6X1_HALSA|nr:archease [Halobacterium salinarum]MBB6088765.1 SHS2 domain-containing protein [Halobacterium salinarum]MDL0119124.1 archease [Halobacterium salinarum]MDL0125421.1 archease [Halobacterium salinarum]MDL0127697.1 archease [Halobacterium salinarum]MDL0131080.1 archease [Halobacterium salinarum]